MIRPCRAQLYKDVIVRLSSGHPIPPKTKQTRPMLRLQKLSKRLWKLANPAG